MSRGTAKIPLDTAGKDTEVQPCSVAHLQAEVNALKSLLSSSPSPKRGPTAWIALERQLACPGHDGRSCRERTVLAHQAVGFLLQSGAGGAGDDAGDAAAVGEMPVGRVDDGVHLLLEQVAANDAEAAARAGVFLVELLRRGGYSIFAFARRLFTNSSSFACTSCCCRRGLTSASGGNFTGRTSSSWMT